MSEQPTENSRYATISQQAPAVDAITALLQTFPHLPALYLTVHAHRSPEVWAQPDTGADVETWRTALQVPSASVLMHRYAGHCSIEFDTVVQGVKLRMFADVPLAPEQAAVSPQVDAERRAAALVEQRHQVEDPAVPPPGFAEPVSTASLDLFAEDAAPVAPVAVRTLADVQGGTA